MKRTARLILNLALCLVWAIATVSIPRAGAASPHERSFQFEYKATVKDIPAGAKQVDGKAFTSVDKSFSYRDLPGGTANPVGR